MEKRFESFCPQKISVNADTKARKEKKNENLITIPLNIVHSIWLKNSLLCLKLSHLNPTQDKKREFDFCAT